MKKNNKCWILKDKAKCLGDPDNCQVCAVNATIENFVYMRTFDLLKKNDGKFCWILPVECIEEEDCNDCALGVVFNEILEERTTNAV